MASLDTNVLLRWLLSDIPGQHKKAKDLIESGIELEVSDIAILETVYILEKSQKQPREMICQNVLAIISQSNINANQVLYESALPLYAQNPALSFADCCLAIYAKLNDATPLYTFDKKLDAQAPHTKLL